MSDFQDAIETLRRLSTSSSHPTIAGHARKALAAAAAPSAPETAPRSKAASQTSRTESMRLAIRELGAISRSATHPDRHRARRALLEMEATYDGRELVAGVAYRSPQAQELDQKMGLTRTGEGVRNEGRKLILSAVGRGQL